MTDLIQYQDGSVVSRTVIKKKSGTVTVFAFDQGQELSEHTAPFDALVYCLDGDGRVVIAGEPMDLKRGQMVIMPADQPHSVKALTQFKMVLVMIRT
jgi:quercetin dioxygenase-like cupin family protein